jgi:hypothetical protein
MLARNSNQRPKHRLASDDKITVDDETMEKALDYLKSRLKPEELSHLAQMLKGEQADDADPSEKEKADLPKPGSKMVASDSRGNTYQDRWPDAARIKVGY